MEHTQDCFGKYVSREILQNILLGVGWLHIIQIFPPFIVRLVNKHIKIFPAFKFFSFLLSLLNRSGNKWASEDIFMRLDGTRHNFGGVRDRWNVINAQFMTAIEVTETRNSFKQQQEKKTRTTIIFPQFPNSDAVKVTKISINSWSVITSLGR